MTIIRFTAMVAMTSCLLSFGFNASAAPSHRVHYTLLNSSRPKLPQRVIVLPVDIRVSERSVGGVTEVVDKWSAMASKNIFRSLVTYTKSNKTLKLVRTPRFSSSENSRITEHLALYRVVVNTATNRTAKGPYSWKHKLKKYDYTIGPGLNFLRRKTSADTALLVYGEDEVSTAGRKTAAVVAGVLGGSVQLGHSFVHIGLVDLRTGNLLWVNSSYKTGSTDLRRADDARRMIDKIFKSYPGIDSYRKAYVN